MTRQTVEKSRAGIAAQIQTLRDELTAPDMMPHHFLVHARRQVRAQIEKLHASIINFAMHGGTGEAAATAVTAANYISSNYGYELSSFHAVNAAMSTPEVDESESKIAAIEAQIADLEAQDLDIREKAAAIRRDVAAQLAQAEAKALSDPALVALKKQLSAME